MGRLRGRLQVPLTAAVLAGMVGLGSGVSSGQTAETQPPPATAELLALGKRMYEKQCIACHGADGRGNGKAAYLLYPKPRDFVRARYRLVSTWEGIPTDQDLFNTISRGIPGSAMPSWGHLPEKERWGLVHYVKSFAEKPLVVAPTSDPTPDRETGTGVIRVPPEPPFTPEARKRARYLYGEACASCHGKTGKGDGVEQQFDEKGYPTRPRDLTMGVFKGNPTPEALYRRIITGLPGSPMPMSDWAFGEDAWHLVHYVLSLSTAEQRVRHRTRSVDLLAQKVTTLPETPDAETWNPLRRVRIPLMPLWWRNDRVEDVAVQAAHDTTRLAIRLSWQDRVRDDDVMHQHGFTDGAAIQFSSEADPPLFAMGTPQSPVNIWHWKAVWDTDMGTGYRTLVDVFPNMPRNLYIGTPRGGSYATGRAAANLLSERTHAAPVEDLNAAGFGTLTSQLGKAQNVNARARWADGHWSVVLMRELKSGQPGDIQLQVGQTVSVALAIWDGQAGDRNGQKSVSIWQRLTLEK